MCEVTPVYCERNLLLGISFLVSFNPATKKWPSKLTVMPVVRRGVGQNEWQRRKGAADFVGYELTIVCGCFCV